MEEVNETPNIEKTKALKIKTKNFILLLLSVLVVTGFILWFFIFNLEFGSEKKIGSVNMAEPGEGPKNLFYPFIAKSSQINRDVLFFYSSKEKKHYETDFLADSVFPSPNNVYSVVQVSGGLGTGWGGDGEPGKFFLIKNSYPNLNPLLIPELGGIDEWSQPLSVFVDWSPDSDKILYMRNIYDSSSAESTREFYLYDIKADTRSKINAIDGQAIVSVQFKDANTLLVKEGYREIKYYEINVSTYEKSDLIPINNPSSHRPDFSPDGSKWVIGYYNIYPEPGSELFTLVLADFPQTHGVLIDSSEWAILQPNFYFSPNGQYVAYQRNERWGMGMSTAFTWVYDVLSGTKEKIYIGRPIGWLDNQTILTRDQSEDDETMYVVKLNKETIPLKSNYYNGQTIDESNTGFVYKTTDPYYPTLRFFNSKTKRSKTLVPLEDLDSRISKFWNNRTYHFINKGKKLIEFNPYSREETVVFEFNNFFEPRQYPHDFLVADDKLFFSDCPFTYEPNESSKCNLEVYNLSAMQPISSIPLDATMGTSIYITSFDSEKNTLIIGQTDVTNYLGGITTFFKMDLYDNSLERLYDYICGGDEFFSCTIDAENEAMRDSLGVGNYSCNGLEIKSTDSNSDGIKENLIVLEGDFETTLYDSSYLGCIE